MAKETVLIKNQQGCGYKYTDLSQIHEYLESRGYTYYQFIKVIDGVDYIFTQKLIKGEPDGEPIQGCRVVQATLSDKSNPAQEQGSALTYARRYSLLMAYGLSTEDDDGEKLTQPKQEFKPESTYVKFITKDQEEALRMMITDLDIPVQKVQDLLTKRKHTKLAQLTQAEYKEFTEELQK